MSNKVERYNKQMSIEDQDVEWFYTQCEKGAIKKPSLDKELKFAELVADYRRVLNSELGARTNAFKMVML
jgi:hypothetical protein